LRDRHDMTVVYQPFLEDIGPKLDISFLNLCANLWVQHKLVLFYVASLC
jgi:hypothetical protein